MFLLGVALLVALGYIWQGGAGAGGGGGGPMARDVQMMRSVLLWVWVWLWVEGVIRGKRIGLVGLLMKGSHPTTTASSVRHSPSPNPIDLTISQSHNALPCLCTHSAEGAVSEELREAIKREVRTELYEKLAEQNKGSGGKVRVCVYVFLGWAGLGWAGSVGVCWTLYEST